MRTERTCRKCGGLFELQPNKPGYVDECPRCVAERTHPKESISSLQIPHCPICGKPVAKEGFAHSSCIGGSGDQSVPVSKDRVRRIKIALRSLAKDFDETEEDLIAEIKKKRHTHRSLS